MISNENIYQLIDPYGFTVTDSFATGVLKYISLLLRWNQRISLTAVTDPIEIIRFHFGESLFAIPSVPIQDGRLADVGSGAGFPGFPLAMANPALHVTLIESDTKKAAFLSEAVRELALPNASVFRGRMDDLPIAPFGFEFITARALGQHKDLLKWSSERLSDRGEVVLWLGEADAISISNDAAWHWDPPIHIPGSKRRFLLAGTRISD
ncbi:MAG: 16S rRNA (guanine(527)-N(7))-methyltransferase RsmG [Candidatus Acidiferrales bacterium]